MDFNFFHPSRIVVVVCVYEKNIMTICLSEKYYNDERYNLNKFSPLIFHMTHLNFPKFHFFHLDRNIVSGVREKCQL